MIDKLKRFFGFHVHEKKLLLIGNICVVKCVSCGMESIPWEVSQEKADAARPHHVDDYKLYLKDRK